MRPWIAAIKVDDEWKAANADKESTGAILVKVIKWMDIQSKTRFTNDAELGELHEEFKALLAAATKTRSKTKWGPTRVAKFDKLWSRLYDWADDARVWVKTF